MSFGFLEMSQSPLVRESTRGTFQVEFARRLWHEDVGVRRLLLQQWLRMVGEECQRQ